MSLIILSRMDNALCVSPGHFKSQEYHQCQQYSAMRTPTPLQNVGYLNREQKRNVLACACRVFETLLGDAKVHVGRSTWTWCIMEFHVEFHKTPGPNQKHTVVSKCVITFSSVMHLKVWCTPTPRLLGSNFRVLASLWPNLCQALVRLCVHGAPKKIASSEILQCKLPLDMLPPLLAKFPWHPILV